jgi:hypothetical protein
LEQWTARNPKIKDPRDAKSSPNSAFRLPHAEPHGAARVAADRGRDDRAQRSLRRELERLRRVAGALLGPIL